jgi:hypothetical protein
MDLNYQYPGILEEARLPTKELEASLSEYSSSSSDMEQGSGSSRKGSAAQQGSQETQKLWQSLVQ